MHRRDQKRSPAALVSSHLDLGSTLYGVAEEAHLFHSDLLLGAMQHSVVVKNNTCQRQKCVQRPHRARNPAGTARVYHSLFWRFRLAVR